jgi:minor histocompatibility antigen H13
VKIQNLVQAKKGAEAYDLLKEAVINAPKTYFRNCLIGYLVAISITIAIMFIFDHGQPALLYLVPGVLGATTYTAIMEDEFAPMMTGKLMSHTEAFWIGNKEEGEEEKKEKKEPLVEKVTKAD